MNAFHSLEEHIVKTELFNNASEYFPTKFGLATALRGGLCVCGSIGKVGWRKSRQK